MLISTDAAWPAARPLLKWTGGKTSELDVIRTLLTITPRRYIEPFVGGGAVLFAMPSHVPAVAGDMSADLIDLYSAMQRGDAGFFHAIAVLDAAWQRCAAIAVLQGDVAIADDMAGILDSLGNPALRAGMLRHLTAYLTRKRAFMAKRGLTAETAPSILQTAILSAFYIAVRETLEDGAAQWGFGAHRPALFWMVREYCYGGMFRTNAHGRFNVAYGGASYNRRSMAGRLAQLELRVVRERLAHTTFRHADFETVLDEADPGPQDFVFLDPPYDSRFSSYDGRGFDQDAHRRLAAWMARTHAPCMLVIKETPFVLDVYATLADTTARRFDKTYQFGIKGRFDQQATHIALTRNMPALALREAA